MPDTSDTPSTYHADELQRFAEAVIEITGTAPEQAAVVARHLVEGNLAGLESHGVLRLRQYYDAVQTGQIDPAVLPAVESETAGTAVVDARAGWGAPAGYLAVELAERKARAVGVAAVSVKNAAHIGRSGSYVLRLAEHGLVAQLFCGLVHAAFVVPWGGREARFGTNPIAIAIPGGDGPVVMDIATSATAEGKVQVYRNAGRPMPEGLIIDAQGHPSTDPNDVYRGGGILPFGGVNGHKGYCLAVMADLLGGSLSGSHVGVLAGSFRNHFLLTAIDPDALGGADAMRAIVDEYSQWLKSSATQPGFDEVLMPGEPESRNAAERLRDGVPLDGSTVELLDALADELGIPRIGGTSGR